MRRGKNITFSLFSPNSPRILLKYPVCCDNINHMKTMFSCVFLEAVKKKKSSACEEPEGQGRKLRRLEAGSDLQTSALSDRVIASMTPLEQSGTQTAPWRVYGPARACFSARTHARGDVIFGLLQTLELR